MQGGIRSWRKRIPKPINGQAFTLVELLVVVGIVSLLASLLLPGLAGSRMQAQQTGCLNNLRQITLAGLMYMNDGLVIPWNDPVMPGYNPSAPQDWATALTKYGGMDQVRICPSTHQPAAPLPNYPVLGTANIASITADVDNPPITSSYGVNGWICQDITAYLPADVYPQYFFHKPSSVQNAAQTPLFFDANYQIVWPLETDAAARDLYTGQTSVIGARLGMGCCTILRHGGPTASSSVRYKSGNPLPGAINMGFDDGHAGLVKLQNLWNYNWHLNWRLP